MFWTMYPVFSAKDINAVDTLDGSIAFVNNGFPPIMSSVNVAYASFRLSTTGSFCAAVSNADDFGLFKSATKVFQNGYNALL